jgi:Na+-driven multidrug efflux pump
LFTSPIIHVLFGSGDALFQDYSVIFFRASAISYPFFALIQTGLGAMRGSGDTKTSVYFSTGVNLLNVLFNVLFLYVFRFGVVGISISLVASRVLVAAAMFFYMTHAHNDYPLRRGDFLTVNMPIQRSVMTVALPTGLEQVFFHGGRVLTQIFIVGFGTMSTAANAAAMPFSNFIQLLGGTMQMALVTIAGMCIGAGKVDEAKSYIKRVTLGSMGGNVIISLLFAAAMPLYLGFFNLPQEAYDMAFWVCVANLIFTPFCWPPSFIIPSGLRAAGDANFTSVAALITMWLVRVVAGYVFGVVLGGGLQGVWYAMFLEWAVRAVIFFIRLRGSKWYRHRVIQD